jgi:hypothetical protein
MFLPLAISPAPLTTFTYICHCCDAEENRPLPLLPGSWSVGIIDGIECAICPDCTAATRQAAQAVIDAQADADAGAARADHAAALERQVELGRQLLDRGMPILYRTIAVLFGTGLAAQIGKLGGIL